MYLNRRQTQPTFSYRRPKTRQNRPFLRSPKYWNQNYYVPKRHHRNCSRMPEFLCSPKISVRQNQILQDIYLYIYVLTALKSILRSTTMGHVYDPAARQIFEKKLKERYAYVQI